MRITILTVGSRGDVQPQVALGAGLQRTGHRVRLAATFNGDTDFEILARAQGIEIVPLSINFQALFSGELINKIMAAGRQPVRLLQTLRTLVQTVRPALHQLLNESWAACADSQLIIHNGVAFAAFRGQGQDCVARIIVSPIPFTPTHTFPSILLPRRSLGSTYNWLTHLLAEQTLWQPYRALVNAWRREQGWAPFPSGGPFPQSRSRRQPVLYSYSPAVIPRPADWPPAAHVTGYWFLDQSAAWKPPRDLMAFLAAGPPPVYVGFGSMKSQQPEVITQAVFAALARSGQRAIVARGWGGLTATDLPAGIFLLDAVPHDWLFPQLAAVIHHGGAGTTAAALRAGVPSVVVPFLFDQRFWGERVAALGVGPPPIPLKALTAERLAEVLYQLVTDTRIRTRAAALGTRLRAEDGVGQAVIATHHYLGIRD